MVLENRGGKPESRVVSHMAVQGGWRHASQEIFVLDCLTLNLVHSQVLL